MRIAIDQLKVKLVQENISDYLAGSTGFRRGDLALFDGKGFDVFKKTGIHRPSVNPFSLTKHRI